MLKSMYIGTSIALSWAWGTSLVLGMEIARTKGIEAFLIWASANSLTLLLFGTLYKKGWIVQAVLDQPIVKCATTCIQFFCMIIQLKILNQVLLTFLDPVTAYWVSVGLGSLFIIWMYPRGLSTSVFLDLFQGVATILLLVGMLLYNHFSFIPSPTPHSGISDIAWGCWAACILLSGIITDVQHWQRAELNKKGYAFEFATLFFATYMTLVFMLSKYHFDHLLNVLLLITVIGVTTSTIDSIAVALHRNFGKNLGTIIGLGICACFKIFLDLNVLVLWSSFGVLRVALALYILYWCHKYINENNLRTTFNYP